MNRKIIGIIGLLLTIILGTYFYIRSCNACGCEKETPEKVTQSAVQKVPKDNPLKVTDSLNTQEACSAEKENEALLQKIQEQPLIIYFKTGMSSVILNDEQQKKVEDISVYLKGNLETKCAIIGHTDNTGTPAINIKVGKERANAVKSYLIKTGIPENRIIILSKGESEPVATNNTEQGRTKNRRAVVTLQ